MIDIKKPINYKNHTNSHYDNCLYQKYLSGDISSEELIELGKKFREIDDNRFQVWVYSVDGDRKYRYHILKNFRNFLDYFNENVSVLSYKQVHHFVARYRNRALIIKNLYEKAKHKQQYSTISERMWNTVLGVGKNTQFINHLIDCGAIVRVYNASGTRKISSIYSLNFKILEQIYNEFDKIPNFWESCQCDCELDNETFEEISNGSYSETVAVFQENAENSEDNHRNFVDFCANKLIDPEKGMCELFEILLKDNIFSTGHEIPLNDLATVARVYGYLRSYAYKIAKIKEFQKICNSLHTNAVNYIKYEPSVHITNKIFHGIGIRAVTELCSKPKYETLLNDMEKVVDTDDMDLVSQYKDECWKKSREYILQNYGELDHFDVSSSIPHVMYLMNSGVYPDANEDLYFKLSDMPEKWNENVRRIVKQSYMQIHFGVGSVDKIYANIKFKCVTDKNYKDLEWIDNHEIFMKSYIENVKKETPDSSSTMDFYHESNIFILLRKLWDRQGIKVIAQVYDSFWFEKGAMTIEKFNNDLKMVSEKYYESWKNGLTDLKTFIIK